MTVNVFFFTKKADAANSKKDLALSASFSARIANNKKSRHSETQKGFHHVGLLFNSPVNTHRHAIYLVVRNTSGLFRKRLKTFRRPHDNVTAAIQIAMQFYYLFIFHPLWTMPRMPAASVLRMTCECFVRPMTGRRGLMTDSSRGSTTTTTTTRRICCD